jgi:ABC-2 type transport system permease protein
MGTADYDYDSAHQPHTAVRELAALATYRDFVFQLVVRNITVRYKRSVLGVAWSMLAPLLNLLVLSLVFTQVFRPTTPNYPLYLFPGLLLWTFFTQTASIITAEVIGGIELWKRVYTPRGAFAVAATLTGLVHLALALAPLLLLMWLRHAPLSPALLVVPYIAVCTALFALGLGLAVASVAGHFADVGDMFQIVLATWMYFTPVIYPRSILPVSLQGVWRLNPVAHLVDAFRMPFYEARVPGLEQLGLITAIGVVSAALGWWLFTRTAEEFARRG